MKITNEHKIYNNFSFSSWRANMKNIFISMDDKLNEIAKWTFYKWNLCNSINIKHYIMDNMQLLIFQFNDNL